MACEDSTGLGSESSVIDLDICDDISSSQEMRTLPSSVVCFILHKLSRPNNSRFQLDERHDGRGYTARRVSVDIGVLDTGDLPEVAPNSRQGEEHASSSGEYVASHNDFRLRSKSRQL